MTAPAASLCTILPEWVATVNDTLESASTTLAGPVVINPALDVTGHWNVVFAIVLSS